MKTKLKFVLTFFAFLSIFSVFPQQSYWQNATEQVKSTSRKLDDFNKDFYKRYRLDLGKLKERLAEAPLRNGNLSKNAVSVFLPNEKGDLEVFKVYEAPVLSAVLSEKFPNIKTYVGFSVTKPGIRARFSITAQGLQVMTSAPDRPNVFIVPLSKGNTSDYIVYSNQARLNNVQEFDCFTSVEKMPQVRSKLADREANDQLLRTFRIAISTNGEYTNFWDDGDDSNGTAQEDALAQVVSTLNRTNEVFEVDMAVNFTLVSGLEIIYPDPDTDPYSGNLNDELQNTLSAEVGEPNYDLGHLFAYESNDGNAGCIGCVCVDGEKGSAYSAHLFTDNDGGPYMSDFFDIDYVPHEIGHQLGATHTWSFRTESFGVNVEPGSGTTIMGYAGIVGPNNVQDHADPYFHYASIDQILDNLESRTCWVGTTISNNPPVADAGSDFTIPAGTAFVLKGAATDPDEVDNLTYTWEQIDNGRTTTFDFRPAKPNGALWRSRPPSMSPDRYMPIIERVISGQLTETNPVETEDNSSWETVSTVSRALNFALTVRDRSEAGGVGQTPQSSFDTMVVNVDDSAGPFSVSSQVESVLWYAESDQTVTWDVAGTDGGNVNSATVNILLSLDGGLTFPFVLTSGVPNNGSAEITVPVIASNTSTARVKVEANDNIFYAINSADFSIELIDFVIEVEEPTVSVCSPEDAVYTFTYNTFLGFNGLTNFSTTGLPDDATTVFSPVSATEDDTEVRLTITGVENLDLGNYAFELVGTSGDISNAVDLELNVYSANFTDLSSLTPVDGSDNLIAASVILSWDEDINATSYEVDIATDDVFTNIVIATVVGESMFTPTILEDFTQYYWRVRAVNDCDIGGYSSASFKTAIIVCNSFENNIAVPIPDNNPNGVKTKIEVSNMYVITDVNVTVNITHSFLDDLIISLIGPNGTEVILSNRNGGGQDNYTNTTFDDAAPVTIAEGSPPYTGFYVPDESLAAFNGLNSLGDWELKVSDNAFSDTGVLQRWSLELCGPEESLSTTDIEEKDFIIFPNPNDGSFTVATKSLFLEATHIEVYDMKGSRIFKKTYSANTSFNKKVDLSNAEPGIYLTVIRSGNKRITRKVVVK